MAEGLGLTPGREITLRDYVDAQLIERDRAVEVLRKESTSLTITGDEALKNHVEQQYRSVEAALQSAERLEEQRFDAMTKEIRSMRELIDMLTGERRLALEKFEKAVEQSFGSVNEFRRALDELSKTMATRREMEQVAFALGARIDANTTTLGELRSRIDVGPVGLQALQTQAAQSIGAQQRGQQLSASMIGWASVGVLVVSVLVGLITRFA